MFKSCLRIRTHDLDLNKSWQCVQRNKKRITNKDLRYSIGIDRCLLLVCFQAALCNVGGLNLNYIQLISSPSLPSLNSPGVIRSVRTNENTEADTSVETRLATLHGNYYCHNYTNLKLFYLQFTFYLEISTS